jgi:hypothetical protein
MAVEVKDPPRPHRNIPTGGPEYSGGQKPIGKLTSSAESSGTAGNLGMTGNSPEISGASATDPKNCKLHHFDTSKM